MNPGPNVVAGKGHLHELRFGSINPWSVIGKTALIHSTIDEHNLDILAVTETCMKSDHPAVAVLMIMLIFITRFHSERSKSAGIYLITRD